MRGSSGTRRKFSAVAVTAMVAVMVFAFVPAAYAAGSWSARTATTPNTLNGVCFVDNNLGWAVGNSGTIRKTTDGAATWTSQSNDPVMTHILEAVTFTDRYHGWAVGQDGKIVRTTDGGIDAWTPQTSNTSAWLTDVGFYGLNNGWATGLGGVVVRYNGTTWSASTPSGENLNGVTVFDANHVWVIGDNGTIMKWNGASWSSQISGTTYDLYDVDFVDANNGWAVGEGGVVLRTANGGVNWFNVALGAYRTLYAVSLTDATHGTIVDGAGHIYRIDNPLYVTQVDSPTTAALYDVMFTDANHGWAVGSASGGQATVIAYTVPVNTTTSLSAPPSVKVKKTLKLTGSISPAAAPTTVTIVKTRLVGKKWKSAGSVQVAVSGNKFAYSFKPTKKGKWRFVAKYAGGAVGYTNYAASTSAVKTVKVK
jgi:photosystem II stability/assembly factor-like uncharacterized protein